MPSPRAPLAVVARRADPVSMPIMKFAYVRSARLLAACRTLDCQACGRAGPSEAAHSNHACHGKGKQIKASDVFIAALCHSCHTRLDQGSDWSAEIRKFVFWQAHTRTVTLLVMHGLWPREIHLPDIDRCPL